MGPLGVYFGKFMTWVIEVSALDAISWVLDAMGDGVIEHYVRCAEWEQEEFDKVVTDWEIKRGFERA